jgi:hyperosmotically inducible periplasmic protein
MKTIFVAVTCAALCTAACGSSDHPAQDATSTTASTTGSAGPTMGAGTSTGATSMMAPTTGNITPSATPAATDSATASGSTTPAPTDTSPSADNTRTNVRDRQGALTPISQGNSSAEIGITAAVRRSVMVDKTLSFTAKNVKIITVGTKVTLRGTVHNDAERSTIEALARQTSGVTDVDDQLDVKH